MWQKYFLIWRPSAVLNSKVLSFDHIVFAVSPQSASVVRHTKIHQNRMIFRWNVAMPNIMTFKMASAHHFEYLKCKFWHSTFALYKISSKLDNPLGSYGQKYNIPIWCPSAKNKKYFTAHNFRQSHNLLQHTNFHQSRIIFDRNYIFNVTAVRHLEFSRILEILKFIFTLGLS